MKKFLIVFLVVLLALCSFGCKPKEITLAELTSRKEGGGPLRYEKDSYTIVEVYFYGSKGDSDGKTNYCYVQTNYYKYSPSSPSGKMYDHCETAEYSCTFTDCTLTIDGSDNYSYSVETRDGKDYVVFSKPFLGVTEWYIDK
jgi:hypothetical protein